MNRVTVTDADSAFGPHVVLVTAETLEADHEWWTFAASSPAWTVEHVGEDGLPDMVHASRRCSNGAQASKVADRTRRRIDRAVRKAQLRGIRDALNTRPKDPPE